MLNAQAIDQMLTVFIIQHASAAGTGIMIVETITVISYSGKIAPPRLNNIKREPFSSVPTLDDVG